METALSPAEVMKQPGAVESCLQADLAKEIFVREHGSYFCRFCINISINIEHIW